MSIREFLFGSTYYHVLNFASMGVFLPMEDWGVLETLPLDGSSLFWDADVDVEACMRTCTFVASSRDCQCFVSQLFASFFSKLWCLFFIFINLIALLYVLGNSVISISTMFHMSTLDFPIIGSFFFPPSIHISFCFSLQLRENC